MTWQARREYKGEKGNIKKRRRCSEEQTMENVKVKRS